MRTRALQAVFDRFREIHAGLLLARVMLVEIHVERLGCPDVCM